jgi:methylmalonyl-CoA mutase C-terminal domain/subunit
VSVFLGGIIPDDDVPTLKTMGVAGVFGPGASTETVIKMVREAVEKRSA